VIDVVQVTIALNEDVAQGDLLVKIVPQNMCIQNSN
jgi:multidrug resistance efflux pump